MVHALNPLESPLLARSGFRHAFFTRAGGVSAPPWDTLNFAASVGDDPTAVEDNVVRAANHLGIDPGRVYFLSQVHGVAARVLCGVEDRHEVARSIGDVTVSMAEGVGCGVRTADCVPVLVGDRVSGAVAAIHSGWRGTVENVIAAGVRALRAIAGSSASLVAGIGPHIEACCFEVGDDVALELARCSSAGESTVLRSAGQKTRINLRAIVRAQLEAVGVGRDAIEDVAGCTVCDRERFHSFRRDGKRSGRMASVIVPRD